MRTNDFTVGNHEVDNKSFGIGMATMIVVAAVGTGLYKGGKWVTGKVCNYLAEKKAAKAQAQQMAQKVKEAAK